MRGSSYSRYLHTRWRGTERMQNTKPLFEAAQQTRNPVKITKSILQPTTDAHAATNNYTHVVLQISDGVDFVRNVDVSDHLSLDQNDVHLLHGALTKPHSGETAQRTTQRRAPVGTDSPYSGGWRINAVELF